MTLRAKFEGWKLPPMDRRRALQNMACGFGALATSAMVCQASSPSARPGTTGLHHVARAKRIIFLFMQGGVSQVDSFDYNPRWPGWTEPSMLLMTRVNWPKRASWLPNIG